MAAEPSPARPGDRSNGRRLRPPSVVGGDQSQLLETVSAELGRYRQANASLASRLRQMEAKLAERQVLSDEQLLAQLPGRTARALQTGKDVADEIVLLAREGARRIEEEAHGKAEAVLAAANTHARAMTRQAQVKAQQLVEIAQVQRQEMLVDIEEESAVLLSDLEMRRSALENEVKRLQGQLLDLSRAHEEARVAVDALFQRFGPTPAPAQDPGAGLQLVGPEQEDPTSSASPASARLTRISRRIW